ncbi:sulfatase-like hydrolase/transferase [Gemmatimonadota bacterium]
MAERHRQLHFSENISRRDFLASTALAAGTLALGCSGIGGKRQKKPNIVFILADDLGYECIGANGGNSYSTPVLDRLAGEGVRFEYCYAQPLCTPTRVKLMTGLSNVRNYVEFGVLGARETTFAQLFRQSGYATCVVGKWQLEGGLDGPGHFGFDEYCLWQLTRRPGRYPNPGLEINGREVDFHNGEYGPDIVSDYALDFISRNRVNPFLLYYPMILTHCPFEPTPASADWDPSSPGSSTYKGDPKYFGDMVSYMDSIVGKLDSHLEKLGIRENTVLVFVGDNGTDRPVVSQLDGREVAGAKNTTTDAGTRVPLIASWPGVFSGGSVCSDMVDMSDFLPTLCECANLEIPSQLALDGRSFLPQLKGQPGNPRDWIYIWFSRSGDRSEAREFTRNQRYKLYRTGEFYDVQADPLESEPLNPAGLSPEQARTSQMLQDALDSFANARPEYLK